MTSGRIAGLDLIRGLAIGLVLVRHAWPEFFGSSGIVGVVVFFALSGYLITGLIVADVEGFGGVRYGRFYRHRALRLVPALLFFLGGVVVVTLLVDPLGERAALVRQLLVALTYTSNLPIDLGGAAVAHLWTLATEEQFYLLWPLLLTFGVRRRQQAVVVILIAAAILVVLLVSILLAAPDLSRIYRFPASWSLALVIGAAARLGDVRLTRLVPRGKTAQGVLGAGVLALLIALCFLPEGKQYAWSYLVVGPVVAALTVVLIHLLRPWRELPTVALRPLLGLGTISYAAYLWNAPIVNWLNARLEGRWVPVVGIALTIVAATVSWWLVERPVRRWGRWLDGRDRRPASEPFDPGATG